MKTSRILASIPLGLMSLMDVGYILPSDPKHNVGVAIAVCALGVAGLVAVSGLVRNTAWGVPAALTAAGVNVIAAIVALVSDSQGAVVGLTVSSIALLLSVVASTRRTAASA